MCFISIASFTEAKLYPAPTFVSYSVEEGLSQVTVYDFAQDPYGFMWLATQTGIDRFDGFTFRHYGKWQESPEDGLPGGTTYQVETDPMGDAMWVGSISGVSRYSFADNHFTHYQLTDDKGNEHQVVSRIHIAPDGALWLKTDYALFRYSRSEDKWKHVLSATKEQGSLQDFAFLGKRLLIGTSLGFYQYDQTGTQLQQSLMTTIGVERIVVSRSGKVFVGTIGDGLYRFDVSANGQLDPQFHFGKNNGLADPIVVDILELNNGSIWITTSEGLSIMPDDTSTFLMSPDTSRIGLADEMLRGIYQNDAGLVWIGTHTSGFSVYDPDRIKFRTFKIGNSFDTSGVAEESREQIWVSNDTGVWKYNYAKGDVTGPWQLEQFDGEGLSSRIYALSFEPKSKRLWLATRFGLGVLNDGDDKIRIVALKGQPIYTVSVAPNGNIWVGSQKDGVSVYNPENDSVVAHWPLSLTAKIYPDSENTAWIANITGLYYLNAASQEMTRFSADDESPNLLTHNVVTAITPSSIPNTYWVGTQSGGLNKMTINSTSPLDVTFQEVAANSRLSTLSIGAILEDKLGNLWMSTTEGIAHYTVSTDSLRYYDSRNGSTDTGYYIGAGLTSRTGKMFFGGKEGLTEFTPSEITDSQWEPKVYITDIDVLSPSGEDEGRVVPVNSFNHFLVKDITLIPGDLSFTVEFTSLDYSSPKNIKFAYRLVGFDPDWRYSDASRRSATYTNLDAGEYRLEIKATNKDEVWSPNIASLNVTVIPPWWQQKWAIVLFIVLGAAVLFAMYRIRVASLERRSNELSRLVEEQTKDLESAIAKLTVLSSQDPLTGISNRRDFTHKAMKEWQRFERYGTPFSLLLIDIDFFKSLNDTYGHDAGDKVLKLVAETLSALTRSTDIVARWGGEEFIILLCELNSAVAQEVAEKIRLRMEQLTLSYQQYQLSWTITIGVAEIQPNESVEACIHRADGYLYRGKDQGRNCVVAKPQ